MQQRSTRWVVTVVVAFVVAGGAAVGALFGERNFDVDEERVVTRSARVVGALREWLPEEPEAEQLVYDGIAGMLEQLDPHSSFLEPSSFTKMRAKQEGSFFGVGIIISRRAGKVTVIAPIAGTPAARKGLRAGDVISQVEGQSTEDIDLDEVVDLVRGPEGTVVNLQILRPGFKEPLDLQIERARIPTNSVRYTFMIAPQTGYVRLSEFTNTSLAEVRTAIQSLQEQGMQRLVLDLRDNPGGPLEAAVGISDMFLRKGQLVVSTSGRTADSESTFITPGTGFRYDGPLVVLVNTGSASASEIVAGAVQDHDRGMVVGETTWGKGLVQTVFTVRGAGLALTTARYYTPAGRSIQRDYDSFIDYITHRNGGESDDVFHTDSGREVLGGGGITPDVDVPARELAEPVVRLYGQSAFFRWAISELQDVPAEQEAAFARAYEVGPERLEAFWRFVRAEELLGDEDLATLQGDPAAVADVVRALHVEVLNAALGLEAGYVIATRGDNQVEAALEALPEAERLWQTWKMAARE